MILVALSMVIEDGVLKFYRMVNLEVLNLYSRHSTPLMIGHAQACTNVMTQKVSMGTGKKIYTSPFKTQPILYIFLFPV